MLDFHSHSRYEGWRGGFLIGTEGLNVPRNCLDNKKVIHESRLACRTWPIEYIRSPSVIAKSRLLKIHPRREKLSYQSADDIIKINSPGLVIVDTLNLPFWGASEYWQLARSNPLVNFLFAHAGGFNLAEFIPIFMYQENVWLDFSMTWEYFGWVNKILDINYRYGWINDKPSHPIVCSLIDYCFDHPVISDKILFGSDEPYFSEKAARITCNQKGLDDLLLKNESTFVNLLEGLLK